MGPTPPGTGVIAPATFLTDSKSTSPQSLPSALRFIPTSMTVAPGRTMSPVNTFSRPTATTMMSALRVCDAKSRVLELQMVTVAPACKSIIAIGLPTIFDAPMTTAFAPQGEILWYSSIFITPYGVHARRRGCPVMSAPAFIR